jgi:hypothetical protein
MWKLIILIVVVVLFIGYVFECEYIREDEIGEDYI